MFCGIQAFASPCPAMAIASSSAAVMPAALVAEITNDHCDRLWQIQVVRSLRNCSQQLTDQRLYRFQRESWCRPWRLTVFQLSTCGHRDLKRQCLHLFCVMVVVVPHVLDSLVRHVSESSSSVLTSITCFSALPAQSPGAFNWKYPSLTSTQ